MIPALLQTTQQSRIAGSTSSTFSPEFTTLSDTDDSGTGSVWPYYSLVGPLALIVVLAVLFLILYLKFGKQRKHKIPEYDVEGVEDSILLQDLQREHQRAGKADYHEHYL